MSLIYYFQKEYPKRSGKFISFSFCRIILIGFYTYVLFSITVIEQYRKKLMYLSGIRIFLFIDLGYEKKTLV